MGSMGTILAAVVVPAGVTAAMLLGTAGTATAATAQHHGSGSAIGGSDSDGDEGLPIGMSRTPEGNSGMICTAIFRSII